MVFDNQSYLKLLDKYQFVVQNLNFHLCIFDGKKAIGFYDKKDKDMKINLIKNRNAQMDLLELKCKAFIQDYMERVIDRKLE